MTKQQIGINLPEQLINVLKNKKTMGVLATFSEKGLPHTTPINWVYPKKDESLLLTIHKDSAGYHNMAWQKKVMVSFLDENNIAYSILGRAGVVRAPSMVHPLMNVVRIDVIEALNNQSSIITIDSGIRWSYTSPEAQEFGDAIMDELKDLAKSL